MQQWADMFISLADEAKNLSANVPALLSKPELTKEGAQALWEKLGRFADRVDELMERMNDTGADSSYISAAEVVQDMFLVLHKAAGKKLIALGGLRGSLTPDER